jgi:hypothetical protein
LPRTVFPGAIRKSDHCTGAAASHQGPFLDGSFASVLGEGVQACACSRALNVKR